MSRTKPFLLSVEASTELLVQASGDPREYIRDLLREQAKKLCGPRGGRYVAVNEPYDFRESPTDNFIRHTHTFTARVTGRYVRPLRDNDGAGTDELRVHQQQMDQE